MSKGNSKRSPKAQEKFDEKTKKAYALKADLAEQINTIKKQILDETDAKKKEQLRKQRDALIARRESIVISNETVSIPMESKVKKTITAVVCVVLIVALVCSYLGFGLSKYGFSARLGLVQNTLNAYTIEDADGEKHDIKVSTYNFYFAQNYKTLQSQIEQFTQYGMSEEDLKSSNMYVDFDTPLAKQDRENEDGETETWLDYVQNMVKKQIQSTYAYYYLAVKENGGKEPAINKDQQKEIDETVGKYKEYADEQGYSLDGYIKAAMGQGITEKVFRHELKVAYIAENYQENHAEELSKKSYEQKDVDKYLKDNADDLGCIDIMMFECETEDKAKAFNKALKADGSNFAELASKYSKTDYEKKANKDAVESTYKGILKATLKSSFGGNALCGADEHKHSEDEKEDAHKYSGLDWLFSKDRKAGDHRNYVTTVVYVIKPAYKPTQKAVNVRHILIAPEKADDNTDSHAMNCTKEQWEEAEKKAKKVLADYNKGKKTSEAFAELAKKNSSDGNASQGGIYEDVYPCQMVPSFNAWIFDSSRKAGDVDIVKTIYGYHIIYFEGTSDVSSQEAYARSKVDSETESDKIVENFKINEKWLGLRYVMDDKSSSY